MIVEETRIGLSSPWVITYKKIQALFKFDNEVTVSDMTQSDEAVYVITIKVSNPRKCAALDKILKKEYDYGNITVKVEVEPSFEENTEYSILVDAFSNNEAIVDIVKKPFDPYVKEDKTSFVICTAGEIVQFYADNIMDLYGNVNLLYEDLMRELIDSEDTYFCTEKITDSAE